MVFCSSVGFLWKRFVVAIFCLFTVVNVFSCNITTACSAVYDEVTCVQFAELMDNFPNLTDFITKAVCTNLTPASYTSTSLPETIGFWATTVYWGYVGLRELLKHMGYFNPRAEEFRSMCESFLSHPGVGLGLTLLGTVESVLELKEVGGPVWICAVPIMIALVFRFGFDVIKGCGRLCWCKCECKCGCCPPCSFFKPDYCRYVVKCGEDLLDSYMKLIPTGAEAGDQYILRCSSLISEDLEEKSVNALLGGTPLEDLCEHLEINPPWYKPWYKPWCNFWHLDLNSWLESELQQRINDVIKSRIEFANISIYKLKKELINDKKSDEFRMYIGEIIGHLNKLKKEGDEKRNSACGNIIGFFGRKAGLSVEEVVNMEGISGEEEQL
jgi:hypothetical protein